jgi:hypothetical protein
MDTKEPVLEAVRNLPDEAAVEDAVERLRLLAKIGRGIEQADKGETISHDQLKQRLLT